MQPPTGYPFRKHQRLVDKADYGRVFKKSRRSRDKCFTVLARQRLDDAPARLGLAISKKHCKKATARNRIKRIVRESFRLEQADLAGFDFVVLNQPAAALATKRELTDSLAVHWGRLAGAGKAGNKDS